MKEYKIALKNVEDVFKLRKIARDYRLTGFVQQEQYRVKMNSVAGLMLGLPLENATLILYHVNKEMLPEVEQALEDAFGTPRKFRPAFA